LKRIFNQLLAYSLNRREYCECSGDCALHEKFCEIEDLNELIASRTKDYIKRPTNTFGQFETPSSNVMAEFVRIADDTRTEKLSFLFFDVWKLKQPDLALTLYGSFPPSKSLQKRFLKMVVTVVHKTLSWVITDGIFDSIAEVMSDGMHGYAEAYGLSRLQVIGIAPWRHLTLQSELHSSNYSGCYRVRFPEREKIVTIYPQIAPFHTRYLFVDSGGKNDTTCIQDFRARFETWLANLNIEVESFELSHNVPICGILVAGRPEHALGVYQALRNGIPFVVIALSFALDLQTKEMTPFVKSCLLKDKVHFLRTFADVGFNMHEFATTKAVEELYSVETQRNVMLPEHHGL
uniref:LSDAT_euk domain-containing protein n=1 Tax=Rodentolepis nana TaxID=102285 RepID=A0A158QI21_RODNA